MTSKLGQKIIQFESTINFQPHWYTIFLNPYFIARKSVYRAVQSFARTGGIDDIVLDVGCGIKPYRHLFTAKKYLGIDIEGGGHSRSQKTVDAFFDGRHIPYPDSSFNTVLATEVFEHVEDLPTLVGEIHRVLRPQGQLFITMPFVWDEHEIPYDFRRFTTFGHKQLLEAAGFTIQSISKTTGIFATSSQLFSAFFVELLAAGLDAIRLPFSLSYPLKKLFTITICAPIQLFGLLLDAVFAKKGLTIDYVVIAKKT